jgi:Asp-tRNA(Asn)/Glu-tRNA(Gln) amidotransferase A subunit family amidase
MGSFREYESYDAVGLAELVARGDVRPQELLDEAIERMERRNPAINAVVIPMLDEAAAALRGGTPAGVLGGVPFLLKDLTLETAGVRTTHGSQLFAAHVAERDSELVRRYRRAGLVTFGKTHSSEFGVTTSSESRLFGNTRNPWDGALSAGGSSGGAAAAVAAGIVPAANASDGGGSIRVPASCCGLVGLKPTRARVPMGPALAENWAGMSSIHAVSRSVRDTAVLLDATCGPAVGDPYMAPAPAGPFQAEVGRAPGRLRIAVQSVTFAGAELHPDCKAAVEDAAGLCRELGHEVRDVRVDLAGEALPAASLAVIGTCVRTAVEDRLRLLGRALAADDLEPNTALLVEMARQVTAADYVRATRELHHAGRRVAAFFESADLLLTPTMPDPPRRLGELSLSNPDVVGFQSNVQRSIAFTSLFNASGTPAVSLPLFWTAAEVPIGVQFAGRFGDEATLLRLAGQLEQARPWFARRPPLADRVGGASGRA